MQDFTEFEAWWFTKKNGKPRTPTCPIPFIEELAAAMRVNAYSPGDCIQNCGMYGYYMNMVLTGTVKIIERDPNYLLGSRDYDQVRPRSEAVSTVLSTVFVPVFVPVLPLVLLCPFITRSRMIAEY